LAALQQVLQVLMELGGNPMTMHIPNHSGMAEETLTLFLIQEPPKLLSQRSQPIDHGTPIL
jgi:hypothetical protein